MGGLLVRLIPFGALALVLALFFAARGCEFWILRAMGVSPRQWRALWILEGAAVLLLGLATGALLGLGLAWMMIPHFAEILPEFTPGTVRAGWPAVARAYLVLGAVYGAALAVLWPILGRAQPYRALGTKEE